MSLTPTISPRIAWQAELAGYWSERDHAVNPRGTAAWQFGFVMEQVLGHASHYQTLRRVLDREPGVQPNWVEVTYKGSGWLERMPGLPASISGAARGALQVRKGLCGTTPDALLFHTEKPAVFQWDWLARVPTVVSLDVTPFQYDALAEFYDHKPDGDGVIAEVKHSLTRRTFALSHSIIAWSSWVKESLVESYGVPAEKVRVIPPGVDMDLWPAPPDRRSEPRRVPRIVFVGGDFKRKGGHILLDWFRQRGRGRCELDLVTRAEIPPEEGVRVHRNVSANTREAKALFYGADIFALPSLGECFGIASVEAMAAGLPVVTTRVGGSRDIVREGQTGFLLPANDLAALAGALDALLDDPGRRYTMGRRAREVAVESFNGATNARAILHSLAEAAASRQDCVPTRWHAPPAMGRLSWGYP